MNTLATFLIPGLPTLRLILPELLLVATLVALMVVPLFIGRHTRVTGWISLAGCAAAAIGAFYAFGWLPDGGRELFAYPKIGVENPYGMLAADRLGMFFRLFLMVFLAGIIWMWFLFDAARERYATEFHTLLIGSALGMSLMAGATNLLLMVIAIELASMPSYALAGFDRFRRSAAEASLKYVIFGAVTSGFMIYGVSILYGMFGTLHIPTLVERIAAHGDWLRAGPLLATALLAVFAGIGFKISAVPFHFWCPDVFQGASLPVATWLSVASKAAGLVLLLRLVFLFAGPIDPVYLDVVVKLICYGIGFFGVLTCTIANLAAFRQTNVRRMLAYSSIAHAGYMLCAGAIVFRGGAGSEAAISAVMQYLLVYMFMNFGAFMTLGLLSADCGSEELEAFTGLGWRDWPVALSLSVCLISLVGLPPLGGFIVKFWLLWALGGAATAAGAGLSWLLWSLVIAIVLNTAISLYYYLRVIRQMYLRGADVTGGALRAPLLGKAALHACAVVILLFGTVLFGTLKRTGDLAAVQTWRAASTADAPQVARDNP